MDRRREAHPRLQRSQLFHKQPQGEEDEPQAGPSHPGEATGSLERP